MIECPRRFFNGRSGAIWTIRGSGYEGLDGAGSKHVCLTPNASRSTKPCRRLPRLRGDHGARRRPMLSRELIRVLPDQVASGRLGRRPCCRSPHTPAVRRDRAFVSLSSRLQASATPAGPKRLARFGRRGGSVRLRVCCGAAPAAARAAPSSAKMNERNPIPTADLAPC
jgi:hypothetical protein